MLRELRDRLRPDPRAPRVWLFERESDDDRQARELWEMERPHTTFAPQKVGR